MKSRSRFLVDYVTSSEFKIEENRILQEAIQDRARWPALPLFEFRHWDLSIVETLEVDLERMVAAEARSAYREIRIPCVVEHAGLIFDEYADDGFPGGLTKPMWNVLGDSFVLETHSSGRGAIARAAVGYCDGQSVRVFVGETHGTIVAEPRGGRQFYWDTVFVPDGEKHTYAEIATSSVLGGLQRKVELSQSTKAMLKLLDYLAGHRPVLWPDGRAR